MENFLTGLQQQFSQYFELDIIRAYVCTVSMCLFGIFLNLCFYFFSKKKFEIKRMSDSITLTVLAINTMIFSYFSLSSNDTIFILKGNIYFPKTSLWIIFGINLFLLLYSITFLKLLRKVRTKSALTNSRLLTVSLFSNLLLIINNPLLAFIAFDIVIWAIYDYARGMKTREENFYDINFAITNLLSTGFFLVFYTMNFFIENPIQKTIVQVCLLASFLLKIGVFPVFNHIQSKNFKTNLPYGALALLFVPYLGVVYLSKFAVLLNLSDENLQIAIGALLLICAFSFSFYAIKTSNIIKIFLNIYFWFYSVIILNILLFDSMGLKLANHLLFLFLGLYSLFAILKLNTNAFLINHSLIKGINKNAPLYSFILSMVMLIGIGVIPNSISFLTVDTLKNIYLFDKAQIISIFSFAISYIVILFGVLKTIQNIYSTSEINTKIRLTKRTTLNYVVPIAIILFLIINIFL